mgnify:CR=1 FL=1
MSTGTRSFLTLFGVVFLSSCLFLGAWACEVVAEERAVSEEVLETAKRYTGDLDEMLDLNRIRVLVTYSKTLCSVSR